MPGRRPQGIQRTQGHVAWGCDLLPWAVQKHTGVVTHMISSLVSYGVETHPHLHPWASMCMWPWKESPTEVPTHRTPLSALRRTSRMSSKSCQEAGEAEEDTPSSLVDREPISGYLGPPAGRPADLVAPACLQDTKPSSTPIVFSINLQ